MSLTGQQLMVGFSKFIGDYKASTSTGAGSSTTLVDTLLGGEYDDDRIQDWYVRITENVNSNQYLYRKINDFVSSTSTATVAPAFAGSTGSGTDYELHRYNPLQKFEALDDARVSLREDLFILRYNDTITADGKSNSFNIPSTIRTGPLQVIEESPCDIYGPWNFLSNPIGNSTTDWTASSATATIVTRDGSDMLIPKYDNAAMRVSVAASTASTVTQTVSAMSSVTAAEAAGRQVTFGAWVYSRVANKVQLDIVTDAGTLASSSQHGGSGWELLTATGVVAADNATTLSVRFATDNDTSAVVYYWNRAWFYYGEANMISNIYPTAKAVTVRRDDTTQKFYLDWIPKAGHQLRLIGKDTLTALNASSTATMEVDEESSMLLYAEAAKILFARRGLTTSNYPELVNRIVTAEQMRIEWRKKGRYQSPQPQTLTGPWTGM